MEVEQVAGICLQHRTLGNVSRNVVSNVLATAPKKASATETFAEPFEDQLRDNGTVEGISHDGTKGRQVGP